MNMSKKRIIRFGQDVKYGFIQMGHMLRTGHNRFSAVRVEGVVIEHKCLCCNKGLWI